MAVSVVSPLLKRLTFVNWDKNGNPFRIDKNRILMSAAWASAFRRVPVRQGSVRPQTKFLVSGKTTFRIYDRC